VRHKVPAISMVKFLILSFLLLHYLIKVYKLVRKMHFGETFRYMCVIDTMFVPYPGRMGVYFISRIIESLKTPEKDTPDRFVEVTVNDDRFGYLKTGIMSNVCLCYAKY
jgi:hypothetical protein